MPVEALLDDPRALALPAAGFGMLCRILLHFWQTECVDLPGHLESIARAHKPTWRVHGKGIEAILSDLIPAIRRARELRAFRLGRLAHGSALKRAEKHLRLEADQQGAALPLQSASHRQKRAETRLETVTGAASRFRD